MPRILSPSDIAEFRDRVCAVAATLLVEVGYGKFTMRDLAKRLGSSAMTPYRYFANKDAILALVKAKGFSMLAERLESVMRYGDVTATERGRGFVRSYMTFAREESSFYKLMFDYNRAYAIDASEPGREEQRVRSIFVEYSRLLSDRMGPDADFNRMGDLAWSALHGVAVFQLMGRMEGEDAEKLVSNGLASIVAAGLSLTMDTAGSVLRSPASNGSRDWSIDAEPVDRDLAPIMNQNGHERVASLMTRG